MACSLHQLRLPIVLALLLVLQGTVEGGRTLLSLDCENEDLNGKALDLLHERLDEDRDGSVETLETLMFIETELQNMDKKGRRDKFHARDDQVSLEEFRKKWKNSAVYNWTEADMVNWLTEAVHLPQYVKEFEEHDITGRCLPRLAVNYKKILDELGVMARIHRKKIKVRALDVVLFGVPPAPSSFWMSLSLVVITMIALVIGYYGLRSGQERREMERQLCDFKKELEATRVMENRLTHDDSMDETESVISVVDGRSDVSSQAALLKAHRDIDVLKEELGRAQQRLAEQSRSYQMPYELARLLHITYQREYAYYEKNVAAAQKRLKDSEDTYAKIERKMKRSTLIPTSIRLYGGRSLVDLDCSIIEAKKAFDSVMAESKERNNRWKRIEALSAVAVTSAAVISTMAKKPLGDRNPLHKGSPSNLKTYENVELHERLSLHSQRSETGASTTSSSGRKGRHSPTSPRLFRADSHKVKDSSPARSSPVPGLKESPSSVSLPVSHSASPILQPTRSKSVKKQDSASRENANKLPSRSGSLPITVGYSSGDSAEHDQRPTFTIGVSLDSSELTTQNTHSGIQTKSRSFFSRSRKDKGKVPEASDESARESDV